MTDVQKPPAAASDPSDSSDSSGSAEADPEAPTGTRTSKSGRRRRAAVEWTVLIIAALVIAFLIKTFLFQAFYIPSESMVPTLKVGDRVLVNKLSYDLHDVNRGDIVVFKAPPEAQSDGIKDLVKRVVGLPGDTVEWRDDGRIYIDDKRLDESYLPAGTRTTYSGVPDGCVAPASGANGCKVPAGHLFMMGDNRSASRDSRYFGPIEESAIVGRVFIRIWPPGSVGLL